ncbi:MAG: DNA translocase FtsK [Verrucomicrobiota bacterium]|nr:DNA translocase FtsK [Verrucomicrobiota bacterium]
MMVKTGGAFKNAKLISILMGVLSCLVFLTLLDYEPEYFHSSPQDGNSPLLGKLGSILARIFFSLFGLSAWLIPWLLGAISFALWQSLPRGEILRKIFTIFGCIISLSVLANIRDYSLSNSEQTFLDLNQFEHGAGGSLGAFFYSGLPFSVSNSSSASDSIGGFLRIWLGPVGSSCSMIILLTGSLAFHFSFKFGSLFSLFKERLFPKLQKENDFKEESIIEAEKETIKTKKAGEEGRSWTWPWKTSSSESDLLFEDVSLRNASENQPENAILSRPKKDKTQLNKSILTKEISEQETEEIKEETELPEEKVIQVQDESENQPDEKDVNMDGFKVVRAAKTEKASDLFPEMKGDYHFPTLELLMEPPEEESNEDEDHMIKARNLKDTLSQFKVEIELGEVHTGPVITRYDVHPAAGVRVEKIANLDKNLAMALKADSVRILAPVPGKGCVGIEVPNQKPAPVCLKEILQSKAWADSGAEIPIVLGKEASGKALVADLTKMPHLLVAGSTGSGKTVCINAIIASLCYHSSPEDVRFIMVDPKIVEMKVYNDLPHMLIPVVTEPKKVPGALKWLLVEMERRYQIFSKVGVRNIAGFNAKILKDKEEKEKAQLLDSEMTAEERAALSSIEVPRDDEVLEIPENKLPYIVCIIDELADLMMVAQADVETGIARLAQLARAAGIHLIIATQRPSVNVITGVIKANLPSRISFRVASYRDSQTILDGKGAEALIGKGDMLFIPPGNSTFVRAQGAFVSDDEINGIVDYLKINGPPQIIEEVREQIESAGQEDVLGDGNGNEDEDPMVRKAIEIIRSTKRASTSNLQRKLSIGYNRAARIMDELEDRGLVGPDVPGQGREILMDL